VTRPEKSRHSRVEASAERRAATKLDRSGYTDQPTFGAVIFATSRSPSSSFDGLSLGVVDRHSLSIRLYRPYYQPTRRPIQFCGFQQSEASDSDALSNIQFVFSYSLKEF